VLAWQRWMRRTAFEGLAVAAGLGWAWVLWRDDAMAAAAAGAALQIRSGALALAWRCPRLDRAGVRVLSRDAPWATLREAEATLTTLEGEAGSFAAFFDGAHRDIAQSARRAVDLHRALHRAERALTDVPQGPSRQLLEEQRQHAAKELESLSSLLGQLRGRLLASMGPASGVADPMPLLRNLEQRTHALGEALQEARALHPPSVGDST